MTPTVSFAALLERREGFLFLPIVYRMAARLAGLDWSELASDPERAARALAAAQAAFGLAAQVSHFRIGVEAEACGAALARDEDGDWDEPRTLGEPTLLTEDALTREPLRTCIASTRFLADALAGRAATVAVLSGPRALSALFAGQPSAPDLFYVALGRAYVEAGANALLIVEDGSPVVEEDPRLLERLSNMARFHRVPLLLLDAAAPRAVPGFDFVLDAGHVLPLEELLAPPARPEHWRAEHAPILATEWEVPGALEPHYLAAWTAALSGG
ncbi:MAG: hypothetical protein HYX52_09615 [Chloroflexi bacterium]|nr:hypothetical protein [Chloroflexota bacterium]